MRSKIGVQRALRCETSHKLQIQRAQTRKKVEGILFGNFVKKCFQLQTCSIQKCSSTMTVFEELKNLEPLMEESKVETKQASSGFMSAKDLLKSQSCTSLDKKGSKKCQERSVPELKTGFVKASELKKVSESKNVSKKRSISVDKEKFGNFFKKVKTGD